MTTHSARFRLQSYGGSKTRFVCPGCSKPHEFTRWLDVERNELLPEEFGLCNRTDHCGYAKSPYTPEMDGQSYVQQVQQGEKQAFRPTKRYVQPIKSQRAAPVCTIPVEIVEQTLRHYDRNVFAGLLRQHFGAAVATDLLCRFEVGTSAHWPGATVFWQRDELGRIRGGQVVLYDAGGHTVKRTNSTGETQRCTTWAHTAYMAHCRKNKQAQPSWLTAYLDPANNVQKLPSLYGLNQLANKVPSQPIAIVESVKTAIICTPYLPAFTWLAVGGLSYLNAKRLRPVRQHPLMLYPDASADGSAYNKWSVKAEELRQVGYQVRVADWLERDASAEQRAAGIDLADLLLAQWPGYPPSWDE